MSRRLFAFLVGVAVALTAITYPLSAQGSLSQQVLQLLSRNNTWTGTNTYDRTKGVTLQSATVQPSGCANTLTNLGGNLYFNCVLVATSAGAGTVTSVALTVPNIFSLTGSPITTTGTLAVTLATQTTNKFFAAPSGSTGTPTFRAMVDADVPDTITINGTNNVTWASVSKSGSSLADLATRSAADLSSGTLPDARFPATLPATSGVNLTALNASNLGSGTVPAARMPALTGDITTSAGAVATTLANTAVTAGTYGNGSNAVTITVDAKGRLTAVSTTAITTGGTTGVANGGTGITSYAVGDLIQATGTTTLARLASVATGNVLISGGVTTASSWGKVGLTTHVSGVLPVVNGGTELASLPANGQLLIGNGTTYTLATLTGTADQITVTNGAGSITLATPQGIATTSTPQFARLGLGTGAGATAVLTTTGQFDLGLFANGNSTATATINWNSGQIQTMTLTAAPVALTLANPITGASYVVVFTQDGTGNRTITWPAAVKWAGGTPPTLSTAPGAIDVCTFRWTGAIYISSCSLNFS